MTNRKHDSLDIGRTNPVQAVFRSIRHREEQLAGLLADAPQGARKLAGPAALLLLGWICLHWVSALDPAWLEILRLSPYIAATMGMLLAVHFHRGRPFFLLLIVAVFYWCYRTFLSAGIREPGDEALYHALCFLVPVNVLVFTLLRERGVFTEAGKSRFICLAGQALAAYIIFHYNFKQIAPMFTARLVTLSSLKSLTIAHLNLVLFLLAAAGTATTAIRRKNPNEAWTLGFIISFFIACNGLLSPPAATIFSLAACVMVIVAVLRESYNMAFRDDLTGIPSRRALNEAIYGLGSAYAIAMVDVDHFKKFNDTHGHDVGDQVLKLVAKKLTCVGGSGKAYRYGGEEFAILFAGQSATEVAPHLENLRQEIADYKLIIRGNDRPKDDTAGRKRSTGSRSGPSTTVTVSIGVAENSRDLRMPEDVIIAADKALYRAKQQGRNRVCLTTAAA